MQQSICPLCGHADTLRYNAQLHPPYWQCQRCALVFLDRHHLLSAEQEKQHYLLHNNDLNDAGYRLFLNKLAAPLLQTLGNTTKSGLDFGCGPGPLLANMLQEAGHQMQVWDPFFANDPAPLEQQYDFISCTEAIEHFVDPLNEWQLWLQLLKPAGVLAIMTKCYPTAEAFSNWYYRRDPTHITFFSQATFRWLAAQYQLKVAFPANDVVIFSKAG
ncbi:class I SAM-dependent methyltransferase [Alishewanella sp. HL-SH05]|uniref:class I SAM-dependent methyltransferase n=1 Tax=Alishewanella sp. HL-SH05 TaxID=3461145 RepID=UPI0040425C2C